MQIVYQKNEAKSKVKFYRENILKIHNYNFSLTYCLLNVDKIHTRGKIIILYFQNYIENDILKNLTLISYIVRQHLLDRRECSTNYVIEKIVLNLTLNKIYCFFSGKNARNEFSRNICR